MTRRLLWAATVVGVGVSLASPVESPKSGRYGTDANAVFVLVGANEAYVSYAQEWHHGRTCGCLIHGIRQPDGVYMFDNDPRPAARFAIDSRGFRFEVQGGLSCCGDGWSAPKPPLAFSAEPPSCTVKSDKAFFFDDAGKQREHHPYVQRGDRVSVVPAPDTADGMGPYVLALFQGPKKASIGLLKKDELDCAGR